MGERTNTLHDGVFRVPWYHRRGRVPPAKLHKITDRLVGVWKKEGYGRCLVFC